MSNTKAFIDYSMQDNGAAAREALYAEIHDRVMSHIDQKKMELAGGILTTEATSCDMEKEEGHEDEKEDKALVKKMVKKDCLAKEDVDLDEEGEWEGESEEDEDSDEFSEDE